MATAAVWAAAAGMVCWLWPPSAAPCMAAWPNTAVAAAAAGACAVTAPPAVCCVAGVGDSAGTFVTDGCADGCMDCAEAVAGALAAALPDDTAGSDWTGSAAPSAVGMTVEATDAGTVESVTSAGAVVAPAGIMPDVFAAVCGRTLPADGWPTVAFDAVCWPGTFPPGADAMAVSDMVCAASDTGEA